jgi:hypothetical protein
MDWIGRFRIGYSEGEAIVSTGVVGVTWERDEEGRFWGREEGKGFCWG